MILTDPAQVQVCGSSRSSFITYGARVQEFYGASGMSCIGTSGWLAFGNNAGRITDSYRFSLSRSYDRAGTSYLRNRFYDSKSGRFTQEDPMGYAGGTNLYAYAGSNPAAFTDVFGLCPEEGSSKECPFKLDPLIIVAPKRQRDSRLDFGPLIDMGMAASSSGNALGNDHAVRCLVARAKFVGTFLFDAGLGAAYLSGAGGLLRGGMLFAEGKAIQTGLILTRTLKSAGSSGAGEAALGRSLMATGSSEMLGVAAATHPAISFWPGKNTYNFVTEGGFDACVQ